MSFIKRLEENEKSPQLGIIQLKKVIKKEDNLS